MDKIQFGRKIYDLRNNKQLKRKELAALTDGRLDYYRIRAIESGNGVPITREELEILNDALDSNVEFVVLKDYKVDIRNYKPKVPYTIDKSEYITILVRETQSSVVDANVSNGKKIKMKIPAHELELKKKQLGNKFLGLA